MGSENLYFAAIIPPLQIQEIVLKIQRDISARFQTFAVLKVVPHITLKAPFKFPSGMHSQVLTWFESMNCDLGSFELALQDFGCFPNPKCPVIYLKPVITPPLMDLQKAIIGEFRNAFSSQNITQIELAFKPHMTVAYRDLNPALFAAAWAEFKSKKFAVSFPVDKIFLMQHNGKQWNKTGTRDLA